MIELQYLATEFNKILGTDDFELHLNTNVVPSEDESKTVCTMVALRTPFALGNIDSETLHLTFTFDLVVSEEELYTQRLSRIKEVLGWRSFQVYTPEGEVYNCDSFLEQQPAGLPRIDTGEEVQQIVIAGTCLVANSALGAVVSNRVVTEVNGTFIRVIAANTALEKGTSEMLDLTSSSAISQVREIAQAHCTEYTLLYQGTDLDNRFLELIEGRIQAPNEIFTVRKIYPAFETQSLMKFISGSITEQAGAYLTYKILLKKVEV